MTAYSTVVPTAQCALYRYDPLNGFIRQAHSMTEIVEKLRLW